MSKSPNRIASDSLGPDNGDAGTLAKMLNDRILTPKGLREGEGAHSDDFQLSGVRSGESENPMGRMVPQSCHQGEERPFSVRFAEATQVLEELVEKGEVRKERPGFFVIGRVEHFDRFFEKLFGRHSGNDGKSLPFGQEGKEAA